MSQSLPYLASPGTIIKLLDKIQIAAVPEKFNSDFIEGTIGIKGGTGATCIPFLKRIGFLTSDGAPTQIYKDYRQQKTRGQALASALRAGYAPLFQANEKIHTANAQELKDAIIHATGSDAESRSVDLMVSSFNNLKKGADFSEKPDDSVDKTTHKPDTEGTDTKQGHGHIATKGKIGISYTIYLNLPNTSDPAVFNAIFKSMRDNLLGDLP